ncbi:unnamed protein product, partial [Ectocarpus sp. 12 AP-2014]
IDHASSRGRSIRSTGPITDGQSFLWVGGENQGGQREGVLGTRAG